MDHAPPDCDGLVIPTAAPTAAWTSVMGLRAVAGTARTAGRNLAMAPSGPDAWRGEAAEGFARRRAELAGRLADVAAVADQAAELIRAWSGRAASDLTDMRVARDRIEAARSAQAAAAAAGLPWSPARAETERAGWRAWDRAKYGYWHDVDATGAQLSGLRDGLRDRPRDGADHLIGFLGATIGSIGGDLAAAWRLTGEALVDPHQWWDEVTAAPGRVRDHLTDAVQNPVDAARQAVGADLWEQGRYGEWAGLASTVAMPSPRRLRVAEPDEGVLRFAARRAAPDAPRPRVQTVDEMLAGVDLTAHEHHDLGHAIRRHVGADDDYLADRLVNGTVEDDGSRGSVPRSASTFPDLRTANRLVTLTVQARSDVVRDFAAGRPVTQPITLRLDEPVGKVMDRGPTGFVTRPGREVAVVLARAPDGSVYVLSAYLRS